MEKKCKAIFTTVLCVLFMAVMLLGCVQEKQTTDTSMPNTKEQAEKYKLSIMTVPASARFPEGLDIDKNDWFNFLEEKTGYDLEWTLFKSGADVDEQLMLILASGNAPDLIQVNPSPTVANLARAGALTPLDEALDKYGNNIKRIQTEEALKLGQIDGKQYLLVRYTGGAPIGTIAIRKDWLEELGLSVPKTLDEYYNVLKSFKQNKPDCIPLVADGSLYRFIHFMGAFGIYSSSTGNFYIEDGKVIYPLLTDKGKEFIKCMNMYYKEGLLDSEFIVDKEAKQKMYAGKGGMMHLNYVEMTRELSAFQEKNPNGKLEYIDPPVGPNGEQGYLSQAVYSMAWLVPKSSASKAEIAVKFLDMCQDDSVKTVINLGWEGKHYKKSGNEIELLPDFQGTDYRGYYSRVILDRSWDESWEKTSGAYKYVDYCQKFKKLNDILFVPFYLPNYSKYNGELATLVSNEVLSMIVEGYNEEQFKALIDKFNSQGGQEVINEIQEWYNNK